MSARDRLRTIRTAIETGNHGFARAELDALADDLQNGRAETTDLGSVTMLGYPRKVHSAYLKLAKAEKDPVARRGLQQTLLPPQDLLAPLVSFTSAERVVMNAANREAVPHRLHQIWIGSLPVPPGTDAWRRHAEAHKLDYTLWREADLERIGVFDHPAFSHMLDAGDYPGAVDIARYLVLAAEGGIYLDCDWYPARDDLSFADLLPLTGLTALAEEIPRDTGMGSLLLTNAFIAAPPRHPVFTRLLDILPEATRRLPDGPAWWSTGPLIMTLLFRGTTCHVPDAAFVAAVLPRGAPFSAVEAARSMAEEQDLGPLIGWKSW